MENYYGSTLLFKTKNNIFRGKLQGMSKDNTQMIILVEDKVCKISILEIEDLQIIETNKKLNDSKFNKLESSKDGKNNRIEVNIDTANKKTDTITYKPIIEQKNTNDKISNMKKNVKISDTEKHTINFGKILDLQNKTMIYNESCAKKMSNLVEKLSLNDGKNDFETRYKAFYNDAFYFYGPTESAFVTIVGELLVDFFSELSKSSFCIILNENSVHTRIGFYLAKRFLDKKIKVSVLRKTNDSVNVCVEKNIYTNLNGKIEKFTDELFDYIIVDSNNKNKYYEHLYRNVAFCLDCENKNYKKAVGFCYGIVKENHSTFDGKLFLIDCGFNEVLYKKYNFENHCDGKISRYK